MLPPNGVLCLEYTRFVWRYFLGRFSVNFFARSVKANANIISMASVRVTDSDLASASTNSRMSPRKRRLMGAALVLRAPVKSGRSAIACDFTGLLATGKVDFVAILQT